MEAIANISYTVKQCREAERACNALYLNAKSRAMKRHYGELADDWRRKLAIAQKAEQEEWVP